MVILKYNTLACAKGMRWTTEEEASDLFLRFSTGEGPHIWQKMGACHRPSESLDKDFLTTADCSAGCVLLQKYRAGCASLAMEWQSLPSMVKGWKGDKKDILDKGIAELVLEGWNYQVMKPGIKLLHRKVIWERKEYRVAHRFPGYHLRLWLAFVGLEWPWTFVCSR